MPPVASGNDFFCHMIYRPGLLTRLQMAASFLIPAMIVGVIGFFGRGSLGLSLGISAIAFFAFGIKRTAEVSVAVEQEGLTVRNLFRTHRVTNDEVKAIEVTKPWLPFWQYWDIGSVDAIVVLRNGARRVVCEASLGLGKSDFESLRQAIPAGGRHG
jgi:hypothetical protein